MEYSCEIDRTKNVKDIQNQPLHAAIPDFHTSTINSHNVKYQLANKQGLRCPNCKNPIIILQSLI